MAIGDVPKPTIAQEAFGKLRLEWMSLDNEYDSAIQNFLDNPDVQSVQEITRLKAMQKRLFDLEVEVLKVAEGKASII